MSMFEGSPVCEKVRGLLRPGGMAGVGLALTAMAATAPTEDPCECLEGHTASPAEFVTEEVMQAMAEKYGPEGAEPEVLFDPDQDYGGPYAFDIRLGTVTHERDGVTMEVPASLTIGLNRLRSRQQVESDERMMEDLGLEPGDAVLEEWARAPMGPLGEPYDYEEIDGYGDLAIHHAEPDPALFVICGDALMDIRVRLHDQEGEPPEDGPAGWTADPLDIKMDFADELMAQC